MKNNQDLIESNQVLMAPEFEDIQELISGLNVAVVSIGVDSKMQPLKMVTFFTGEPTEDVVGGHHHIINESYVWAAYKPFVFSLRSGKLKCSNPNRFKAVLMSIIKGVRIFGAMDCTPEFKRWQHWNS